MINKEPVIISGYLLVFSTKKRWISISERGTRFSRAHVNKATDLQLVAHMKKH
jgi:hypothetical protein